MVNMAVRKAECFSGIFVLAALIIQLTQAANVAMVYELGKSHWARFVVLGDALLSRGHDVTVVAPEDVLSWIHRGEDDPFNYLTFPRAGSRQFLTEYIGRAWTRVLKQRYMYQQTWSVVSSYRQAARRCQSLLSQVDVLDKLRQADIILGEPLSPCAAIVSSAVGVPSALLSVPMPASWLGSGAPGPTCCYPVPFSGLGRVRTFRDRVHNLAAYVMNMVIGRAVTAFYFNHLAKKYIDEDATFVSALADTDLWLLTVQPGLDPIRPHMPNMVNIGGFMARPAKPLTQELEDFMQGSGHHGVVIFSLGTFVKGMPRELAELFATAFAMLLQRVVWLYDESETPCGLGNNTKLMNWIPQNDLLGHPKTRVFLNHGGLNGLQEAMYHGVPMVILPLTVEHKAYADVMVARGTGLTLDIRVITPENVVSATQEVIGNSSYTCSEGLATCPSTMRGRWSWSEQHAASPRREIIKGLPPSSYKENAGQMSQLLRDQPQTPLERAVWWIEHIIRHGGLPHLRTNMNDVPFYQYFHLDVLVAFAFVVSTLWISSTRFLPLKSLRQKVMVGVGLSVLAISLPFMYLDGL